MSDIQNTKQDPRRSGLPGSPFGSLSRDDLRARLRSGRDSEEQTDAIHIALDAQTWVSFSLTVLKNPLQFAGVQRPVLTDADKLSEAIEQDEDVRDNIVRELKADWRDNIDIVGAILMFEKQSLMKSLRTYPGSQFPDSLLFISDDEDSDVFYEDDDLYDEYLYEEDDDSEEEILASFARFLRDNAPPSPPSSSRVQSAQYPEPQTMLVCLDPLLVWNVLSRTVSGALLGNAPIILEALRLRRHLVTNDARLVRCVRNRKYRVEDIS